VKAGVALRYAAIVAHCLARSLPVLTEAAESTAVIAMDVHRFSVRITSGITATVILTPQVLAPKWDVAAEGALVQAPTALTAEQMRFLVPRTMDLAATPT